MSEHNIIEDATNRGTLPTHHNLSVTTTGGATTVPVADGNIMLLVSNGKNLVIKNQASNQYYIYSIEKTPLNLLLDKEYLIKKMQNIDSDLIDNKFYRFKFEEGENQINIFFDKKSLNLIGWQNIDLYQNLVVTYMFNIESNTPSM